jgi:hypothetical protein
MTQFAHALHQEGHLRPAVTADARDLLWTCNSRSAMGCSCSPAAGPPRHGRWLADPLTAATASRNGRGCDTAAAGERAEVKGRTARPARSGWCLSS